MSLLLIAAGVAALQLPREQATKPALAFTHVAVVDVATGVVRRDQTVVVDGRRIATVGAFGTTRVPAGARIVDGSGRYLIPGLWDMHAHLAMAGRQALPVLIANGVTGVRDMGGGIAHVRAWRDSVGAGSIVGPRIRVAGPIIEGARWREGVIQLMRGAGQESEALSIAERIGVSTPDDASRAVDSVVSIGGEFVKTRTVSSAETFYAILRAARARGLRVAGHAPTQVPLASVSDSGMASIEHSFFGVLDGRGGMELDSVAPADRRALFDRFVRNGTAVTPTLVAGRGYRLTPNEVVLAVIDDSLGRTEPRRRYVSTGLVAQWRTQIDLKRFEGPVDWVANDRSRLRDLREMVIAGVPILAGTDLGAPLVYPGFSLHDELELLVRHGGMTPAAALRAATLAPAVVLGATDSLGVIAPGMLADLVLLRANPLDDIRNTTTIHAVVTDGRVFARPALDSLLAESGGRRERR